MGKQKMNAHLDQLRALRAQIENELATLAERSKILRAQAESYDRAIAIVSDLDSPDSTDVRERRSRGAVKDTALRLLQEHAEHGLSAAELVEVAAKQGVTLDRGSVSSLLSKLKGDGTLTFNKETGKYRGKPPAAPTPPGTLSLMDAARAVRAA